VAQALTGNLWMHRMSADQELRKYVTLWKVLQPVQLEDRELLYDLSISPVLMEFHRH
jgi:hypothetical protein